MVMESRTVNEILQTLDEYIADLRLYQQLSHDEVVHNRHHQSMIRYALQTAIQCVRKAHRRLRLTVIDIGNYILTASGFERPEDNKDIVPKSMDKYSIDMELTVGDGFVAAVR